MEPLLNYSFFFNKKKSTQNTNNLTKLESKLSSDSAKLQYKKNKIVM